MTTSSSPSSPAQRLRELFAEKKCWRLAELAQALQCAPVSARRLLAKTGYFRSFTHNGKWYTLPGVPEFNPEGIWRHQSIGFSEKGSLTQTLVHLVERSATGLSAAQLSQKLQHPCHPVLTGLHKDGKLDRVKFAGEFRYLSVQPRLNRRQRKRTALERPDAARRGGKAPQPLNARAAVFVLVEYVKNPGLDFGQLAERVRRERDLALDAESIRLFFEKEGLKKTSEPSSRRR